MGGDGDGDDEVPRLVVNGGVLEEVEEFCYLGNVLDCDAKVTTAWRRWQEIASLLVNHSIELRTRGRVYDACKRSALLYGAETWALANRLIDVLCKCDCRKSSSEVAEMCGVEY